MITTINEFKNTINQKWFHGSDYKFTTFQNYKSNGPSALGIFVTDDKSLAELFGQNIYDVNISYKNPYKITMNKWDSIREKHARDTEYFINMRNDLITQGYDCIFIKNRTITLPSGNTFKDPNIVVLFDKNQIKINSILNENLDYKYDHRMTKKEGQYATLDDMTKNELVDNDFYTHMHYYYNHNNIIDKQSAQIIKNYHNKPEQLVTIYRAVPKGITTINPGDWVTINKQYAIEHGLHHTDSKLNKPVISMKVAAKYVVWDGNDVNEFAYFPE